MKITFLHKHPSNDGGTRVIAIYADRLRARGHDVTIISLPAERWSLRRRIKWRLTQGEWPVGPRVRGSHLDPYRLDHRVIDRYRPIIDGDVPDGDVVIATWWETAHWAHALSDTKGAKVFFIQHDERWMGQPEDRVEAAWRLSLSKITISRWLEAKARNEYGDDAVIRVPNSVDTEQFHAPARNKNNTPTVGLMYSNSHFKGCDVSLKALAKLREQLPDMRLVCFGHGRLTPDLPLPDGAKLIRHPAQDALRNLYARCDVWLCGSRAEGFHLPPLEAMACRCPVVSTRVGGPMDIIEDGCNGYLVDIEDADALADRLLSVLSLEDDQWQAMSDAAHATALAYTWDDATDRFEQALRVFTGAAPATEAQHA